MTLFSQLSRGSNVEIGSEMDFSSLLPGVKVVERFGTWRLKLAEGRPLRISGENYFCHITLPTIFSKELSRFDWRKKDGSWSQAGNHSCFITGWRGRDSCRKFSSKMRRLLKKPQFERMSGKNIHQNILTTNKVPDNIRQWVTLPCQHLPSIATTLSDWTLETAKSSQTGLASSLPGIAASFRWSHKESRPWTDWQKRGTFLDKNLRYLTSRRAHPYQTTPSVLSPMDAHRWCLIICMIMQMSIKIICKIITMMMIKILSISAISCHFLGLS